MTRDADTRVLPMPDPRPEPDTPSYMYQVVENTLPVGEFDARLK